MKRIRQATIVMFATLLFSLIGNISVYAQSPSTSVVINEVMYDAADEWVELYVVSSPGDMTGWTLEDTAGNTFTFPTITPNIGEFIVIHTGYGTNDLTPPVYELYWNRGSGVWNNTGDEILLSGGSGTGVDYIAYEGATKTINGSLTWNGTNPSAATGNAIALDVLGVDTDSGDDWHEVLPPPTPSDAAAANWLRSQQDASGGFPWTSGGSVTNNTQGPTAQAELMAFVHLGNTVDLDSAIATGDYLVPTYPRTYTDGDPRFATHDPLFLEKLSIISNTTMYADFVQVYLWDKLTTSAYGETNDQDAAAYATSVVDARQGQGYVALSPWDLAALPIAADIAGETTIRDDFMSAGVLEGLNRTTAGDTFEVIGLAGAVWASAETGIDLDPTTGAYSTDDTTADLAARLAAAQLGTADANSGGWASQFSLQNASTQTTAYTVIALNAFDRVLYHNQIAQGIAYLRRTQAPSGQILNSPTALSTEGGGVETHAEALRALIAAAPNAVCVDDDFAAADFGDALDGSACGMGTVILGYDAFETIANGIDAVAFDGIVNVADGRYPETPSFTKNVTIAGQSEAGVVIDTHTFNSYGLYAHGDTVDVTLRNFTLIGPMPGSFGYGIKIAGDNARAAIENVTVTDSGRSGIDLNGLAAITVTHVTAQNNGGVGLALTDSSNATISGLTTDGNAWGGAAVYVYGRYYTLGSDNVVFTGTNTFGETPALTLEATPLPLGATLANITNLTLPPELSHSVQGSGLENYRIDYTVNLANALTAGVLGAPLTYVRELTTGDFYVAEDMSIQTAEIAASDGDTIHILDGTFPESVVISTNGLTLDGASEAQTTLDGTVDCTISTGSAGGISITPNISGTTISNMTITGFDDGIQMFGGPVTNTLISNTAAISNCRHGIYSSMASGLNGLTLQNVNASNNNLLGSSRWGRGIWVINGEKQNITIENSTFNNNRLVGIDISDGSVTNLNIASNNVENNGDSGIAVLGAQGPGATLVSDNTVNDNGRFGIEIKNSTGNGGDTGAGSVVLLGNFVSRTVAATDLRDHAGIAVFRRLPGPLNADQPSGVVIRGNSVSGYRVANLPDATGEGFGIVVEGETHLVVNNNLIHNDVGLQAQAGNPVSNEQSTPYFDRGDASATINLTVVGNTATNNSEGMRSIGAVTGIFTDNLIYDNSNDGLTILDEASANGVTVANNQFCDNGALGIENQYITATLTATENWWGAVDGPGAIAAGHGDEVSEGVDYSAFITTPPTTGPCQIANLTVAKVTEPATGETGFAFGGDLGAFSLDDGGSQLFQLTPNNYIITEAVKSGWELTDATCTADSLTVTDGVSLAVARGDDVTCTFTNDPLPAIELSKTANALTMPEPGGIMTFTVQITNTTAESVTLTELVDDIYGDLNGLGSCSLSEIAGNDTYACDFSGAISGNAGDILTDTVSVTVADSEDNTASATDNASVTLTDVLPTVSLTKAATPDVLPVGGGVMTFTVTLDNLSVESVYLVSLYDDNLYRTLDGDLNGIGSCSVGEWIAVDDSYQCVFTQTVTGEAGDVRNDKVTASVIDDENNIVTVDSTAGATINTPPEFVSTPPMTATVGTTYTYVITVTDADSDPIIITASILPTWLSFTDNGDGTATLTGTPATDDAGIAPITLIANDGQDEQLQQFDIEVSPAPEPDTRIYIFLPLVIK